MSSLEVVIFVIIVIFLGARMIGALRERKAKAEKTIPVSVDAPVASAAEPEILGPDELPPLTARLHHLEAGFAAFAASTAHPREVGETYFEHGLFACRYGAKMALGGLAAFLHRLMPFLFQTTGSRITRELNAALERDPTWRPSATPVPALI